MELFELECYDGLNATHRWLYITLSNRIFYYNLGLENTFFTYRVQIFDGTLAFDKVRMGILYVYYTGSYKENQKRGTRLRGEYWEKYSLFVKLYEQLRFAWVCLIRTTWCLLPRTRSRSPSILPSSGPWPPSSGWSYSPPLLSPPLVLSLSHLRRRRKV